MKVKTFLGDQYRFSPVKKTGSAGEPVNHSNLKVGAYQSIDFHIVLVFLSVLLISLLAAKEPWYCTISVLA